MSEPKMPIKWQAEKAQVGHFEVLRALPMPPVDAVGPFVFLDHFGPMKATGETLGAHPHAGIEVISYLLTGANVHRDSQGHEASVQALGAQWMNAGRGILHAETKLTTPTPWVEGLQLWARLPIEQQWSEPEYASIDPEKLPHWQLLDGELLSCDYDADHLSFLRLLIGRYANQVGPIPLKASALCLHLRLAPGQKISLALPENFEMGLYVIKGAVTLDGDQSVARGEFEMLPKSTTEQLFYNATYDQVLDVLILGGEPAPRPLVFAGPFVLDSMASVRQAQKRFFSGEMGRLDGVPF